MIKKIIIFIVLSVIFIAVYPVYTSDSGIPQYSTTKINDLEKWESELNEINSDKNAGFSEFYDSILSSPDGNRSATLEVIGSPFGYNLSILDKYGSPIKTLITDIGQLSYFDWSPDSEKLTIVLANDFYEKRASLLLVDVTDGDIQVLKDNIEKKDSYMDGYCRWSPEGDKIAYISAGNIYTINADGKDSSQITFDGNAFRLKWSPDGTKIAYVTRDSLKTMYDTNKVNTREYNRLHIINDSGGSPVELNKMYENYYFAWTQDSKGIMFNKADGLYFVDLRNPVTEDKSAFIICFFGTVIPVYLVILLVMRLYGRRKKDEAEKPPEYDR